MGVAGLVIFKRDMEATVEKVFEIYIRTTPEQLWRAITDPGVRARYQFGARVESSWTSGSSYQVTHQGAPRSLIEGENLEVERQPRLVQASDRHHDPHHRYPHEVAIPIGAASAGD